MKKYKLIAMDLDGTLTQHKSKLEKLNTELLLQLQDKYLCVIVGAGSCERIYKQINSFPIDIIGNYGMQISTIKDGQFSIIKNLHYDVDRIYFENTILKLRDETGYKNYVGESVEFHPTGVVTFPLLGTKANLENKLAFDPDGKKRSKIYATVAKEFDGYNCFIGGSSSFDIVLKTFDKYIALVDYAKDKNIELDDILYIGDDFKVGGNDEQIKLAGIDYVEIKDYNLVCDALKGIGII